MESWDGRSGPIATTQEAVDLLGDFVDMELEPTVLDTFELLRNTETVKDSFTIIGTTAYPLDGERTAVRSLETNLGRLVADSTLWFSQHIAEANNIPPAQIALKNSGGIRGEF